MNNILISIIIPVYQAEAFLEKSVESILKQTLKDIEILLIDDGSKDKSGEICDQFAVRDQRVRVIHKKNGGQSSARNAGINAALGKYIGFMDNDDFLYPEMCQLLYENAEQYNAEISAASFITENEAGIRSHDNHSQCTYVYDNRAAVEAYLARDIMDIYVWTKIYRKDFLDKYHIRFEKGRSDEDWLFNHIAFVSASKVVMKDTPIYLYIERNNSTCRTFHKTNFHKYIDDTCYRLQKIEKDISDNYPQLIHLAQRQTIIACFKMLSVMSNYSRKECEPYYTWVKTYLQKNSKMVIKDKKLFGMTSIGVYMAGYMPPQLYFILKRLKHSIKK
ncbi:glycosyltransferase [Bacteroides sp.]|uniref:glycosyltransferase family 2 protein n=1 Tax=Bacteroides sp. TaxID=29523 RepID=UPI00261669F4|nr:glycosyltransferase [Bacteroides sp.]